jgi:hypothetical protein
MPGTTYFTRGGNVGYGEYFDDNHMRLIDMDRAGRNADER